MTEIQQAVSKVTRNLDKTYTIRESHRFREELLRALQQADLERIKTFEATANQYFEKDTIDLMKLVEGNSLQSFKNIMLSNYHSVLEIIGIGFIFNLNKEKTDKVYADLSEKRLK